MRFKVYRWGPPNFPALLLLLTLANFLWFPGQTWLQSDTQIYVPIFDHLASPELLRNDLAATRPHVTFTIYDEVTLALAEWTDLPYAGVLQLQQFVTRLCGIGGVYLLAGAMGLPPAGAFIAAGVFALGAVVNGPSVLTFEYEPVPRGFAVMLVFAALGAMARNWWAAAGVFAVLATLYHPTTTAPFWGCVAIWLLRRTVSVEGRALMIAVGSAAALLAVIAKLQIGPLEPQPFFGRIDAELEALQRLRGAYNWIGLWPREWLWQYPLLFAVVFAAWRRLRGELNPVTKFFALALPVYGLAMIPVTWFLLDQQKWIFMPQFQPARAVLFITAFAMILGAAAAWHAAQSRRWLEAGAWLAVASALPLNGLVLRLFTDLPHPLAVRRLGLLLVMCAVCVPLMKWSRGLPYAALAASFLPFVLIPVVGQVKNYPDLHTPEIRELASWARNWTEPDDVFLFADVHRDLAPGIFRAESLRALYVDWKTGGQVNILPDLGREWGLRWRAVREAKPPLLPLADYRALGIDYLVVRPANLPSGIKPVYENLGYAVIRLP